MAILGAILDFAGVADGTDGERVPPSPLLWYYLTQSINLTTLAKNVIYTIPSIEGLFTIKEDLIYAIFTFSILKTIVNHLQLARGGGVPAVGVREVDCWQ